MQDRLAAKGFGVYVFCVADAMFLLALCVIYGSTRGGMRAWPDIDPAAVASATLPLVFVGVVAVAAGLARARRGMGLVFVALISALGVLALFWSRAADQGLTPRAGRYGQVVFLATIVLAAHVAGALIAAGIHIARRTSAPFLGRFLVFFAAAAFCIVTAVFVL